MSKYPKFLELVDGTDTLVITIYKGKAVPVFIGQGILNWHYGRPASNWIPEAFKPLTKKTRRKIGWP